VSAIRQRWSAILDAEVAAGEPPARHLEALRIPKLEGWESGRVWMTWTVDADLTTPMGPVFGGYLAALADHVMACALFTVLEDHETFSTSDLHANFLHPVRSGCVEIEALVINRSERAAACETRFSDTSGRLLVRAVATQAIRSRPHGA
jgi:uncharacterized protein (TIGR00369 family)